MKRDRNWLDRLTDGAELSGDALPGVPIVELAGDRRVLIENHRGVTEYGREQISVRVSFGHIRICGCGLELARMTKEQLVICGRISSVSVVRRGM